MNRLKEAPSTAGYRTRVGPGAGRLSPAPEEKQQPLVLEQLEPTELLRLLAGQALLEHPVTTLGSAVGPSLSPEARLLRLARIWPSVQQGVDAGDLRVGISWDAGFNAKE